MLLREHWQYTRYWKLDFHSVCKQLRYCCILACSHPFLLREMSFVSGGYISLSKRLNWILEIFINRDIESAPVKGGNWIQLHQRATRSFWWARSSTCMFFLQLIVKQYPLKAVRTLGEKKEKRKKKLNPFRQNLLGSIRPFLEPIQYFVPGASLSNWKPP